MCLFHIWTEQTQEALHLIPHYATTACCESHLLWLCFICALIPAQGGWQRGKEWNIPQQREWECNDNPTFCTIKANRVLRFNTKKAMLSLFKVILYYTAAIYVNKLGQFLGASINITTQNIKWLLVRWAGLFVRQNFSSLRLQCAFSVLKLSILVSVAQTSWWWTKLSIYHLTKTNL